MDKRFHTVGFNLFLRVDPQLFADFNLNRQTVGVPAGLPLAEEPLHRLVAGVEILDRTGQTVPRMWKPVCRRRSLIEDEFAAVLPAPLLKRFLVDVHLAPAADQSFFILRKVSAGSAIVNRFTRHC